MQHYAPRSCARAREYFIAVLGENARDHDSSQVHVGCDTLKTCPLLAADSLDAKRTTTQRRRPGCRLGFLDDVSAWHRQARPTGRRYLSTILLSQGLGDFGNAAKARATPLLFLKTIVCLRDLRRKNVGLSVCSSYAVEREELDPTELEDGTWVTPKTTQGGLDPLDLQHKYKTAAPKPSEAMPEHASTPALVVQAARPLQLPRRRPMPRLPSEHYKIVIRPRHPINLSNIGLATLLEAIQNTAKVDPAQAEEEDKIGIHPIKNTLTVSTPHRIRAEAYRSLEVLRSQRYNMNLSVATYVPAADDSICGVVYKAYTDETDHDLQVQLMKKNTDILIVNARRLGSSKHLVITFAEHKLPATIRFRCFTLEVHPLRERPEACFNCRKLGHRTDVCPLPGPGIPKCRRCGGEHPHRHWENMPTCTPQCVVCLGEHPTGSKSCKLRFTPVKPNNSKKTSMSSSTV
ncbi:hypothetical protein HPB51_000687 [Rhipicephalus microplus]|uniref:CCHC-type domain-containing protein n=1 Tax=Rhipicephalus microplus TaxID=6941 RepID=A0A9J6EPS4_RHIMP|nr:hypothetical protein HPB51_000687 [Rhipicephalus microplus]